MNCDYILVLWWSWICDGIVDIVLFGSWLFLNKVASYMLSTIDKGLSYCKLNTHAYRLAEPIQLNSYQIIT